ncbi:MAG: hypothetical protein J6P60_05575 [Lachnospiraceae bacterium]|nr:hypothetical protein [Lachnospiraceae bacterium]
MKEYSKDNELVRVVCNGCKKEMNVEHGILKEGLFEGTQTFGFFSRKDGCTHAFDLCEDCYDRMIGSFLLPVTDIEEKELL